MSNKRNKELSEREKKDDVADLSKKPILNDAVLKHFLYLIFQWTPLYLDLENVKLHLVARYL